MSETSVAFIGSVGVPNVYGGFESFLESCSPVLAARGHVVLVTCDARRYTDDQNPTWNGVDRVFVGLSANGVSSIFHDLVAFIRVFPRVNNIVVLGVSAGLLFPFFRICCDLFSKRLIVNVDGVEWRRPKFGAVKRMFLRVSDLIAQCFSHVVVIDNEGLRPYVRNWKRRKVSLIAYPGDQVDRIQGLAPVAERYLLTVCRVEPENNVELILRGFESLGRGEYVFIGNWQASEYGRRLRRMYGRVAGLRMLDPTYDGELLARYRGHTSGYIHGHSVGGTNPSLVEMLFYDAPIACFDCEFNRFTCEECAVYFSSLEQLVEIMGRFLDERIGSGGREIRARYTRDFIVDCYETLLI